MDDALQRRLERALADAHSLIDEPTASLEQTIEALVARLEADDPTVAEAQAAHRAQLARLRKRFDDRLDALSRVHEAIGRLRDITAPTAMLAAAAEELCRSSDFERVLVSTIGEGTMTVGFAHFGDDPDGAREALAALREQPIRLEHPLIETEILRRRRATVVSDAQLHQRVDAGLLAVMGWSSYVAAPVSVRSRPIAMIHADRGRSRPLDVLHRDVLWEFATGLAQTYESADLRRTMRQERIQMREFLERLNARSAELSDSAIELMPHDRPPSRPDDGAQPAGALEGLLTRRELEVLELLGEGRSNRSIADELVISERTVKFHVNGILRKLHVTNRAEAVSRYLALSGLRGRA